MRLRVLALALLWPLWTVVPRARAGSLPTGFLENRGQLAGPVRYYSLGAEPEILFTDSGLVLSRLLDAPTRPDAREPGRPTAPPAAVRGFNVRLTFENASATPTIEALRPLPGRAHFFLGRDRRGWRTDVPSFAEVAYRDLWPGVDLVFYRTGELVHFDLVAAPGADLGRVAFRLDGAGAGSGNDPAERLYTTPGGTVELRWPRVGAESGSIRWSFAAGPVVPSGGPGLDDPTGLLWSTHLGSVSQLDAGKAIALDGSGNPVVVGFTHGGDFPTTPGAFDVSWNGLYDAFVSKLSADGSQLLWSTFLGGDGFDLGTAVALDPAGNVMVVGSTGSDNFPVTFGVPDSVEQMDDIFVTRLNDSGSALLWSTLLGGSADEQADGVALDAGGNVHVAGITSSADYPTTNGAFDRSYQGNVDACVTVLAADGRSLLWSTYLGSSGHENMGGIALTRAGASVVTGITGSPSGGPSNFPITHGVFDPVHKGGNDVFVTEFSATGALVWSTFLGGSQDVYGNFEEFGHAVAVDTLGDPIVAGTAVAGFPTTAGAYQPNSGGLADAFVVKLNATASALLWSTFLGGSGRDEAWGISLCPNQDPMITGYTASSDFPTTPYAFDRSSNGGNDAFVACFGGTGGDLRMSTFLGGSADDEGAGVAAAQGGEAATVTGWTTSTDFPVSAGAYDTTPQLPGTQDAFVASIWMLAPAGVPGPCGTSPGGPAVAVPNPAPFRTGVRLSLGARAPDQAWIFDARGRLLRTLAGGPAAPSGAWARWDGRDEQGNWLTSGEYFYALRRGPSRAGGKIVILP